MCPEYLYGKMTVYAPTLIKKTQTAVNGFTFLDDNLFINSFPYPLIWPVANRERGKYLNFNGKHFHETQRKF